MVPITPQAQSSAPAITLATLREVLADAEQAHPERATRLFRAATIVALRRIEATPGGTYWVQSECDPTREYWVCPLPEFNVWRCTCKDFQQRGGPCKHALAVQLLQCCAAPDNLIRLPVPTLDPDASIPFELTPKALALLDADPTAG